MIKKYNVVAAKNYEKNGDKKTIWLNIGTITEFDQEKKILELNMIPNETFRIFPREDKPKQTDTPDTSGL